ncbi:MAG: hypothetical protein C4326_05455 [Ignavibacteria bacterium]
MSKKTRTWIIVIAAPVVLVVGAVLALKLYFTGERLKALVLPRIEAAVGRKVEIADIGLSVFPTIGLDVRGLTIANKPGFADAPLLTVERILLDVKLLPLFDKRVEVSSLLVERPRVLLETAADGTTNYAEKRAPGAQPEPSAGASTMVAVLLPDVRIVNGFIDMIDHRDNSRQTLEGFDEQASVSFNPSTRQAVIESRTAIEKYSYGSISTPLITDWRINADATIVFDVEKRVATIGNGKATLNAIPFGISGTIDTKEKPLFDLTIAANDVNVAQLLHLTPKAYVEKIKGVQGNGAVQATVFVKGVYDSETLTLPDLSGTIRTTNASMQFPNIPKPITNIALVCDFVRGKTQQEFHIRTLTASLGQNPLSLTMDVVNFDDPSLNMNVNASVNLAEVKDYYPLEPGTQLSGTMKANMSITGKINKPDAMKASGSVECSNVTIATATSTTPIKNLSGSLTFNNQLLESRRLAMMIGTSDLTLAFTVRNYLSMMGGAAQRSPKATASVTLTSSHLSTADIMGEDSPKASAPAAGAPHVRSAKAAMPLPNVAMDITATIGTLTMKKLELKNVRGTMTIADGVITLQNLTTNVFDGIATAKGTIDMQRPERPHFSLSLDLKKLKAHAALSAFTSFGQRLFGDMDMHLVISGALNDTMGFVPQSLNATGTVALANGKLAGVKVNQQIAGMLNLPDLQEIAFKDWSNSFTIKEGRVSIPELKITALGADYTIKGSHGLDGTLDLTMGMLLSEAASSKVTVPGFAGEALNALKEPNGRLKLDFLIGGTTDNPNVRLDANALQARAAAFVRSKLDAEKEKLQHKVQDEVKKKGEELLKGLIKKK